MSLDSAHSCCVLYTGRAGRELNGSLAPGFVTPPPCGSSMPCRCQGPGFWADLCRERARCEPGRWWGLLVSCPTPSLKPKPRCRFNTCKSATPVRTRPRRQRCVTDGLGSNPAGRFATPGTTPAPALAQCFLPLVPLARSTNRPTVRTPPPDSSLKLRPGTQLPSPRQAKKRGFFRVPPSVRTSFAATRTSLRISRRLTGLFKKKQSRRQLLARAAPQADPHASTTQYERRQPLS